MNKNIPDLGQYLKDAVTPPKPKIKRKGMPGRPSNREKNPVGGQTQYRPEFCDMLIAYARKHLKKIKKTPIKELKEKVLELPTIDSFAVNVCDVTPGCFQEWRKRFPELEAAAKKAQEMMKEFLILAGNMQIYHPIFAMFTAKNVTDMRDTVNVDAKGIIEPRFIAHDNKLRRSKTPKK
jgi:hypothetical protein